MGQKNKLYRQNKANGDIDFPEVYAFQKYVDATYQSTSKPDEKGSKGYASDDSNPDQSYSRKQLQRHQMWAR